VKPSTDPPRNASSDLPVTVIQPPETPGLLSSSPNASDVTGAYGERPPARTGSSPERIDKYQIVRALGDGGQAIAYLAFDPDLKRQVVLKVYHAARTPAEQEMVLKEGQALARVRSGYVAQCYSAERHDSVPYLVMEYIPGKSLAELQRDRPPELDRSLELVGQLAEGLSAVHACGLLHRDIKPSNAIVGDDGLPRLVDFGLAEPLASAALARVSGTIPYMAPEQARGESDRIDARTDLFALGAVLYELLTGRPPYLGETRQDLLSQACTGDVVPPRERNPKIPAAVNTVCMRCLAKAPGDRFASAADLAEAVRGCRRRGWRGLDLAFRLGRYRFRLAIGAAAVLLLLLTPLAVRVGRSPRQPEEVVALKLEQREEPPGRPEPAPTGGVGGHEDRRPAPAAMRPMTLAQKTTGARHPVNGSLLRQDFALRVTPVHGTLSADGKLVLKQGEALALTVESERAAYLGVWFVRPDGTAVQLLPNDREADAQVAAKRPRTVPQQGDGTAGVSETVTAGAPSTGLEYVQVRAATRSLDAPKPAAPAGPRHPFPLFTTPEDRKAIREFLLQPPRVDGTPRQGEGPTAVSEVVVPLQVR
jgi:predicted Ser/Thr protein kinase